MASTGGSEKNKMDMMEPVSGTRGACLSPQEDTSGDGTGTDKKRATVQQERGRTGADASRRARRTCKGWRNGKTKGIRGRGGGFAGDFVVLG